MSVKNEVTRSNIEKPCVRSRRHIFSPIIMRLSQNVFFSEISEAFENGSCQVKKTRSLGQMLETPYVCSRGHIFSPIIMKLDQHFVLMKSRTNLETGHVG